VQSRIFKKPGVVEAVSRASHHTFGKGDAGSHIRLGEEAVVEVTGLRSPCVQLDHFQPGLMAAVLDRDGEGGLVRKAGVMAIVVTSGDVRPGDPIAVEFPPPPPHARLERV
jgi:MOSC domain-containing protein YiiM